MSKNDRIEEMDRAARAMGLATVSELAGGDTKQARMERDLDALPRRIHELPPLNGREEITFDPHVDDPTYREHQGEWGGPKPLELQRRYEEWHDLVVRAGGEPTERVVTERAAPAEAQDEMVNTLWSEFRAAYPDHAKNTAAVEAAAEKIINAGGFDPSNRAAFYDAVAVAMGEDDGRSAILSPSAPGARRERAESESDMIGDLHRMQRTQGIY